MTEVRFYHMRQKRLEEALPELLAKVLSRGHRAVVKAGSAARIAALDTLLWTYDPATFLPHGTEQTGHAEDQPVYLTTEDENPNGADVLLLIDGAESAAMGNYPLVCALFDGNDESAVATARDRWTSYKAAGFAVEYHQQDEQGRWEKKSSS